jgi:hypothetical protein
MSGEFEPGMMFEFVALSLSDLDKDELTETAAVDRQALEEMVRYAWSLHKYYSSGGWIMGFKDVDCFIQYDRERIICFVPTLDVMLIGWKGDFAHPISV